MEKDPIIETRICRLTGKEFSISQKDVKFYKKISPKFGDYIAQIPYPTLCPEERQRRRLSFRNERKLYRRQCDASKKPIISIYSPDEEYIVYDQKIWWSDEWDAMDYGRQFDFSKTFTEQFDMLLGNVPRMALNVVNNTNSPYVSFAGYNNSSYMIYTADQNDHCMFGSYALKNKSCVDFLHTNSCEEGYWLIHCDHLRKSKYCFNCKDGSDCLYSVGLQGSTHCVLCVGLLNAEYCINNIQYTKVEYQRILAEYEDVEMLGRRYNMVKEYVGENDMLTQSESCTGSYMNEAISCLNSENVVKSSNIKYCSFTYEMHDSMDWDFYGDNGQYGYESVSSANNLYNVCFIMNCRVSSLSLYYSDLCMGCKDCFGCVGLRHKQYCIFNKQYTKEEYEVLVPKIIEHMKTTLERGEFFDSSLSPFGYNETVAQEYFPLEKEGAVEKLYKRSDYEMPQPQVNETIHGSKLPHTIEKVEDKILEIAIECETTGKLFRIIPQELKFYRKHSIPLPKKHPDQRHLERLAMRK